MTEHERKIDFLERHRSIASSHGWNETATLFQSIKEDLENYEKLKRKKPKVITQEVDNTPYGVDWDY